MRFIAHLYYLVRATYWLALVFIRADWYFKHKTTEALAIPHPETLNSKEQRRLQHYFYGTTYLSVIFCSLRGSLRNTQEYYLFSNLSALAYFFDDLSDEYRKSDDSDIVWKDNPEQYGKKADQRGLAQHFLNNMYQGLESRHVPLFKNYMHRVFNIETSGRQQQQAALHLSKALDITAEKGGCSVLLFRTALQHSISVKEEQALFQFGLFIQLCDDIFDFWFDIQDQTETVATLLLQQGKATELNDIFKAQYTHLCTLLLETEYPKHRVKVAIRVIHYLASITALCLSHYEHLQSQHPDLSILSRKTLVVDMERWLNRFRAGYLLVRGFRY